MGGLKSGHVYRVRVLAHNQKGKGSFSKPAELLTNFAAPSPPPTPSISGRSTTSIVVTWGPPECDGGSPITAWVLRFLSLYSTVGVHLCSILAVFSGQFLRFWHSDINMMLFGLHYSRKILPLGSDTVSAYPPILYWRLGVFEKWRLFKPL